MTTSPRVPDAVAVLRRALHPPVDEARFWAIQAMVVVLAGLHLLVDVDAPAQQGLFPGGIPVALLIVPVGYAAWRYGLAGSAATGVWATILWLPDLLLPRDEGHVGADVIDLALVLGVALFFGQLIEAERRARTRVEQATAERLGAEVGYRHLFEANRAPILVLGSNGIVRDANPAATALFGVDAIGASASRLLSVDAVDAPGRVVDLDDGRHYRVRFASLPPGAGDAASQVILEDVTEERTEGRRAARYAALVVAAEEDQRRHLARELHDEPLQLFLHLARRLESLGRVPGVPTDVALGLGEARAQALAAATRLRDLARELRPPALDRLGLVAALSSLLADVEQETGLDVELEVTGTEDRLASEIELGAFRIVQEAVRNTVRHASARRVEVAVGFLADEVTVEVSDDGLGFAWDDGPPAATGHLGLLGMAERATVLGGSLDVRTAPGEGAVIRASFPTRPDGAGAFGDAGPNMPVHR